MRNAVIGFMLAALVFGFGIKTGWDWRGSTFDAAASRLQDEATKRQADRNAQLEREIAEARAVASAASAAADMADEARLDAINQLSKLLTTGVDPAELAAVNLVLKP